MQGDWVDVWLSVMDARGLGRCMAVGGESLQAQCIALVAVKVCFIN